MGWRTKMRNAKKAHRPSLRDWECDGFHDSFSQLHLPTLQDPESLILSSSSSKEDPKSNDNHHHWIASNTPLPIQLDARTLTTETFRRDYDAQNIPCIIHNIPKGFDNATPQQQEWAALREWTLEKFDQLGPPKKPRHSLRESLFKCGEDDNGKAIKVKLKYFLRYLHQNRDDSPLYIFDSNFDGKGKFSRKLLLDYTVPSYFQNDLFRYISSSRRPPYRWILIGPQRSGSCIHIDPLATHAWNTLLYGQKRWVLFPPHVPKQVVKGTAFIKAGEDDEAIHYFTTILPRIKTYAAQRFRQDDRYHNFACYEFTQQAGETVFVPHGWWHAVLNLTHTIGVTQNYASTTQFDDVWMQVRTSRQRMAWKLLEQLRTQDPALARRAEELNRRDRFVMKYDPVQVEKRRKKEKEHVPRKAQLVV